MVFRTNFFNYIYQKFLRIRNKTVKDKQIKLILQIIKLFLAFNRPCNRRIAIELSADTSPDFFAKQAITHYKIRFSS